MSKLYRICVALTLYGALAIMAHAANFHLTDGTTLSGDIITLDENGIVLKQADGKYSDHVSWSRFSQADLKELMNNPKAAPFVEPFIEITQQDKIKRTEIDIKDVPRLQRAPHVSIFAALFKSGIGIFAVFMLYLGNLYAAYEVAVFRGHPPAVVIGLSAVLPVIIPIIFGCTPVKLRKKDDDWAAAPEDYAEAGIAEAVAVEQAAEAEAAPTGPVLPPTKTFTRGQSTFNRRFFETQMSTYFGVSRPEADKDMVLKMKATRGTYNFTRISRIGASELHIQVAKGASFEDVTVPFIEIQEVEIKHKDA